MKGKVVSINKHSAQPQEKDWGKLLRIEVVDTAKMRKLRRRNERVERDKRELGGGSILSPEELRGYNSKGASNYYTATAKMGSFLSRREKLRSDRRFLGTVAVITVIMLGLMGVVTFIRTLSNCV